MSRLGHEESIQFDSSSISWTFVERVGEYANVLTAVLPLLLCELTIICPKLLGYESDQWRAQRQSARAHQLTCSLYSNRGFDS